MHPAFVTRSNGANSIPIWFVTEATWAELRARFGAAAIAFAQAAGFEPKPGRHLLVPGPDAQLGGVLFGLEPADRPVKDRFLPGRLSGLLPAGTYRFANAPYDLRLAGPAFVLGAYRFTRYRKGDDKDVRLEVPDGVDGDDLSRMVAGVALARDLINTPANDMGPAEIELATRELATRHGA